MEISVIVTTAPGREDNLDYCLEMLQRQTVQGFEIIVVDDGSATGHHIVARYASRLDITHLWRPNDRCVSRSRNLAAEIAKGPFFIFIDSDVLLYPKAIEIYGRYFKMHPESVITGFCGSDTVHQAPSQWFSQRQVNYLDKRVHRLFRDKLVLRPGCYLNPILYCWGGQSGGATKDLFPDGGI